MPPSTGRQRGLRFARLLAAAALLTTAAASCSLGGSPSPSGAPQGPSAGVGSFATGAFVTDIPAGWTNKTKDTSAVASVNAGGTVLMLLYAPATAARLGNEHIDVSLVAQPVPDDQLMSYLESAAQHGATNLARAEPFDLNGSTGIFITYDLTSSNGVALEAQDMLVNHSGNTYDIVLNTALSDFVAQLPALQRVLSTWRWRS